MNTVGMVGPAICLSIVTLSNEVTYAITILCIGMFCGRFVISGFWVNMLDISPMYAGQLMGISNTFATIPGLVGNALTGYIINTYNNWAIVFWIASALNIVGAVIFLRFASSNVEINQEKYEECLIQKEGELNQY